MKAVNDVTALVVDHGLFLPVALRLARDFKRVLYYKPGTEAFPTLERACVGDGFPEIERVLDPWPVVDAGEVDLAVFPDILDAGMQEHLERSGVAVWGSRRGDSVELVREKFLRLLRENGLAAPEFKRVVGLTALRELLRGVEDRYVKISRWRGSMETWHWRSEAEDGNRLDQLAVKFGALREKVPFLVFEPIATEIEDGADLMCVDGSWADQCLRGIEAKDKGYFAAVTAVDRLPRHLREILEVFGAVLGEYRYRNFFSIEVRVADDAAYFIDPCCRGGLPATGSQLEVWRNLAEFVWAGANGELVELEPAALFTAECVLTMRGEDAWRTVEVPARLRDWVKVSDCCNVDGVTAVPPDPHRGEEVGWLVATGDTPTGTLETLKARAAELPSGLETRLDALVELVQEAEAMREAGIAVTAKAMPDPAAVVATPA